jgi:hypothetical protein
MRSTWDKMIVKMSKNRTNKQISSQLPPVSSAAVHIRKVETAYQALNSILVADRYHIMEKLPTLLCFLLEACAGNPGWNEANYSKEGVRLGEIYILVEARRILRKGRESTR